MLDAIVTAGKLRLSRDRSPLDKEQSAEIEAIEAVIGEHSPLIDMSAQRLALFDRYNVNLLAVSRHGERIKERLGEITFRFGDVIVLQGQSSVLPTLLREFGCLPLAKRTIMLGSARRGIVPLVILLAAIGSTAFGLLPVSIAFFAGAVAMVLFRAIPLAEVYTAIDGPILMMLATLIPVSDALRTSGGTDLIAQWLNQVAYQLRRFGALTPGGRDGRHPVPEQCRNGAGDGADCHEFCRHPRL